MTPTHPYMDEYTINDLDTLKMMADPLRMRLLALLQVRATVKEAAAALGLAAVKLYYHLNLLETHDLVRVVDLKIEAGVVEKVYMARARRFRVVNPLLICDSRAEATREAPLGSAVDVTRRKLANALQAGLRDHRTPPRFPFVSTKQLRLTDTQLTVLHKRLEALLQEVNNLARLNEGGQAPLYELALLFTPDPGDSPAGATAPP